MLLYAITFFAVLAVLTLIVHRYRKGMLYKRSKCPDGYNCPPGCAYYRSWGPADCCRMDELKKGYCVSCCGI